MSVEDSSEIQASVQDPQSPMFLGEIGKALEPFNY
jgi:hypothetical protein